jgi:AraC-like DNA-binding protein
MPGESMGQENSDAWQFDRADYRTTRDSRLNAAAVARAMRVAEMLLESPGDSRSLADVCRKCGASKRTLERLFLEETQLTLGRWRQQARLLHAIKLIAGGEKITTAALDAGYNSPSAFITMFKRLLGSTPARYFDGR